jgi:chromosome segregation ATPase
LRAEAEADARDLRLAAESYGKRQRQLADEEARRIVAEARAAAEAAHADEERRWQAHLTEVEGRLRTLRAETERLEAKRARIVRSLRALSNDIADAIVVNGSREVDPEDLPRALSPARRRRRR